MNDFHPEVPVLHLFGTPSKAVLAERSRPWQGDSFSFGDLLDIINPLQHLPIISTVYRYLTGDTIGALPRIIGDGLFGGPLGLVSGMFNASLKQETGKDAGEEVIALVTGGDTGTGATATAKAAGTEPAKAADAAATAQPAAPATKIAEAATPPQPTAPPSAQAADQPAPKPAARAPALPAASASPAKNDASPVAGATVTPGSGPVTTATRTPTEKAVGIPLHRGAAPAPPPVDPRVSFRERVQEMRRATSRGGPSSHVVPLQGAAAELANERPRVYRVAAEKPAAATPAVAAAPTKPPTIPPGDIAQRMMDALAKYAKMQQQRDAAAEAAQRGTQVDVAP